MSEPIPESVPTSLSRPSQRPTKKLRTQAPSSSQLTALSNQAAAIDSLMSKVDSPVVLPSQSSLTTRPGYIPPEIVANVQGSSAGAGSGEFHVYKASRRREYERIRNMEEETRTEAADAKWEKEREEKRIKDEKEREKKRAKRMKKNLRKGAKKDEEEGGMEGGDDQKITSEEKTKPKKGNNIHLPRPNDGIASWHEGKDEANDTGNSRMPNNNQVQEMGVIIHDDDND